MPSADYFLQGAPGVARAALHAALTEHGFTVTSEPNGSWTVARGSTAMTVAFGALAGRSRQRLVYQVQFFDHQGTPVARFFREQGAGVMGGALGVSRSNDVFAEVSQAVAARLEQQGLLAHWLRAA
jgi:predicted ATPase